MGSISATAASRSCGTSSTTGRGRPVRSARIASTTRAGIASGERTIACHLLSDAS
jgi:hypothetical protein